MTVSRPIAHQPEIAATVLNSSRLSSSHRPHIEMCATSFVDHQQLVLDLFLKPKTTNSNNQPDHIDSQRIMIDGVRPDTTIAVFIVECFVMSSVTIYRREALE